MKRREAPKRGGFRSYWGILSMIALATLINLAIVTRGMGTNALVANAEFSSGGFKQRREAALGIGKTVGELKEMLPI